MDLDARWYLLIALALVTVWYVYRLAVAVAAERRAPSPAVRPSPSLFFLATGFVTNFFDTLGIGSFATTTAIFRATGRVRGEPIPGTPATGRVRDELIPGTLNVGHTLNAITQAFIFITLVKVDPLTLILMIGAAVSGAWLGSGVVAHWPRRNIQIGMGAALFGAATLMLLTQLHLVPGGGTLLTLRGTLLGVAIVMNFVLGSLMTLGIGLYAPCMILVSLLGMDPTAAFPIMMGSCAFLMPIASARFMDAKRADLGASLGLLFGGIPAVLIAAFIVKSLPLTYVRWLIVSVVVYTAIGLLRTAFKPAALKAASLIVAAILLTTLAGCKGEEPKSADDVLPKHKLTLAEVPVQTAVTAGFHQPESVYYDSATDVFFVSNINGDAAAKDDNGFISRVRPDLTVDSLKFIAGGRGGVTLHAPKGIAIIADTLWVADIDAVRAFDKRTGAPVATVDLRPLGAVFLNDIAVGPDGSLYITDTGPNLTSTATQGNRIFRVDIVHRASVALHSDSLGSPNGITWDSRAGRFVIVQWTGARIVGWRPGDSQARTIGFGSKEQDGVEILPDGRMVVTSWAEHALIIRSGADQLFVRGFDSPADIGVDPQRQHVAIPLLTKDRVELWNIPPLAQTP